MSTPLLLEDALLDLDETFSDSPKSSYNPSEEEHDSLDTITLGQGNSINLNSSTSRHRRPRRTERAETPEDEAETDFLEKCFGHLTNSEMREHWRSIDLSDFRIYQIHNHPSIAEPLHVIAMHNNEKAPRYCFSGRVAYDAAISQDLSSIEISSLEIDELGGLDDDSIPSKSCCADTVYLQTDIARKYNCFYRLRRPHTDYRSNFHDFMWLADFMKYIVDYLVWATASDVQIGLEHFRKDFLQNLLTWQSDSQSFDAWHERCGRVTDFRRHLASSQYAPFIAGQANGLRENSDLSHHPLWDDINQSLEPALADKIEMWKRNLVTDHVAKCFLPSFPLWGKKGYDLVEVVRLTDSALSWQRKRQALLGAGPNTVSSVHKHFEDHGGKQYSTASLLLQEASQKTKDQVVRQGDLIGKAVVVQKHADGCPGWQCNTCPLRFALVTIAQKPTILGVKWLTLPDQTVCSGLNNERRGKKASPYYPIGNELFYTDECCCETINVRDIYTSYQITIDQKQAVKSHPLFVFRQYSTRENAITVPTFRQRKSCHEHPPPPLVTVPKARNTVSSSKKIKLMSSFSGCGTLDAGLAAGSKGLIEPFYGVEIDKEAFLSLKANHKHHPNCIFHNNNVNKVLAELLLNGDLPEVDLLVAGCPCVGWSSRNPNPRSKDAQRNCTFLAHTLSWIEILLPKMVLIENVEGMDRSDPSAAGQAVCHLVSLGYQVKLTTIEAHDYGGPTIRKRLFIVATIPGITLPAIPEPTHGHGPGKYPLATASSQTTDLNAIPNETVLNIRHPDHVPTVNLDAMTHSAVAQIPHKVPSSTSPKSRMCGIYDAYPRLNAEQRNWFHSLSKEQQQPGKRTYTRVHPNKPKATITATFSPSDSRGAACVHWAENRIVSVEELRRWQGIPEDFIIVGRTKLAHIRQIGNGVAFAASTLFGELFAQSWRDSKFSRDDSADDGLDSGTPIITSKVEDLSDTEEEDVKIVDEQYWHQSLSVRRRSASAFPTTQDHTDTITDTKKEPESKFKTNSDDQPLPDLSDICTPTPRSKRYKYAYPTGNANPANLPDLADLVTPTKHNRELVQKTNISERVSITPGGSVRMHRDVHSKVTVRKRRVISDNEDEDEGGGLLFKRPRASFGERIRVDVLPVPGSREYEEYGATPEKAIELD